MREKLESSIRFPLLGLNVVSPQTLQPEGSTVDCKNVRVFDSLESRSRGGMRPGLSKYCGTALKSEAFRVQDLNHATYVVDAAPDSTSINRRRVAAVGVSGGTVVKFDSSGINTASTSGNAVLSSSVPFMFSAELHGRLYYTDGISYKTWVGSNNTAIDWTPTAGSLPGTPGSNAARLIETWRSRIVFSGLRTDPHNWFMSALGDPLDFDYTPDTPVETQAVEGGVGVVGKFGDVVNAMIPFNDDVLLFGCDHSIWQLNGDPELSGRIDLVSDQVGLAFGRPWCKDPFGNIYAYSTNGSVYRISAGEGSIVSLSDDRIAPRLTDVDLNTTIVRMAWDEAAKGFHLFFGTLNH